ncbi:hypothetical protein L1049_022743 [Liquidambar formosana]|uniref:50S ribosomal protein L35 n=1 Tax=Liquidambar formosana TaxID=63359 RepID=A0AAP0RET6_LIQFO
MMQRLCVKLRSFAIHSTQARRLLHSSSPQHHLPLASAVFRSNLKPLFVAPSANHASMSSLLPLSLVQMRHFSSPRERKKRRKPMTPVVSKLKKIKMKSYSSFKFRFRTMNDGNIRRWREGKRHNAHLKSKKSKRRLRRPAIVPAAYAKVMKKLNFCG